MKKITKVRTIIFTETCPLQCRYCISETRPDYNFKACLPQERVFEEIDQYDKEDDATLVNTMLEFSGGEPFLYFPLIKEVLLKYGNRFSYSFNTSGYPLTEEMIEFLSKYSVKFVFTMDGATQALADYVKPVRESFFRGGYFEKVSKIVPTLLFYFPDTPFRMIVDTRYVDLIFEQYLAAEKLGFRFFTLIPNYKHISYHQTKGENPQPFNKDSTTPLWTKETTEKLIDQIGLIGQEIFLGWAENLYRPRIVEMDTAIKYLLQRGLNHYSPETLPCQVMQGRTLVTHAANKVSYCLEDAFPNREDLGKELTQQYEEVKKQGCNVDPSCEYFDYCCWKNCPKDSYDATGRFFQFDDFQCSIVKPYIDTALRLLAAANEGCPDSLTYKLYLRNFIGGGKNGSIDLLSNSGANVRECEHDPGLHSV